MKIPDFEQWHFTLELLVNAQIQSGVKIYSPPKIYKKIENCWSEFVNLLFA